MRDLEIRGAGSLFGDIQSGHMEQVGYETYTKLFQEIIYCKDNGKLKEVVKGLIDRYGEFTNELKNFVKIIILRNMAEKQGISKIIENKSEYIKNTVNIHINDKFNLDSVEKLIKTYGTRINFKNSKSEKEKGIIIYKYKDETRKIEEIHTFLNVIKSEKIAKEK